MHVYRYPELAHAMLQDPALGPAYMVHSVILDADFPLRQSPPQLMVFDRHLDEPVAEGMTADAMRDLLRNASQRLFVTYPEIANPSQGIRKLTAEEYMAIYPEPEA